MAKKKARQSTRRKAGRSARSKELIISKSRTKAAAKINVSGDFYGALDSVVRNLINAAETRAKNNGRKTLRPHDL